VLASTYASVMLSHRLYDVAKEAWSKFWEGPERKVRDPLYFTFAFGEPLSLRILDNACVCWRHCKDDDEEQEKERKSFALKRQQYNGRW
jgi:hypothetical protein